MQQLRKVMQGTPEDLVDYMRDNGTRLDAVVQLLGAGRVESCYHYLRDVAERDDVRAGLCQAIGAQGWFLTFYLEDGGIDRAAAREALIRSGNGVACLWYLLNVQEDSEVRKAYEEWLRGSG